MPTHVHLMILPKPEKMLVAERAFEGVPVATILSTLKQSVAKRALLWAKRERPASLALMLDEQPNGLKSHRFWQRGGGYDQNLFTHDAVWEMIHYIHLNPVRDGLCARAEDWPWSSAMTYRDKTTGRLRIDEESLRRLR